MNSTKKNAAEVTAATTGARTAVKKDEEEPIAYLGPDLKNISVNGTVYVDGLPEALQEKIKEVPALKSLVVPISNFAAAGVAIATQGTALNNLYNAVSAKLQEQQKKNE